MNIKSIQIVRSSHGSDHVILNTDLESACPNLSNQSQHLSFEAARGSGVEYCRKHFNIEPELIEY